MDNKNKRTCHGCGKMGTRQIIQECCVDCCVGLCRSCRDDPDVQCGCYGECHRCGRDVNRGENGWPCDVCEKWLCMTCKYIQENSCAVCNPPACKNCGESSPQERCTRCHVTGCEECCRYQCRTCHTTLCRACVRFECLVCGVK
jgi:hypothetical protein